MTPLSRVSLLLRLISALIGLVYAITIMFGILSVAGVLFEKSDSSGSMMPEKLSVIAILIGASIVMMLFELIIAGLKAEKKWGWISALIMHVYLVMSPFFPIGIIGLYTLLNSKNKEMEESDSLTNSPNSMEKNDVENDSPVSKKLKLGVVYIIAICSSVVIGSLGVLFIFV